MHHYTSLLGMLFPLSSESLSLIPLACLFGMLAVTILMIDPTWLKDGKFLTISRAFWGMLVVWIASLSLFNPSWCQLVAYAGNRDASVVIGGHEIHFKAGEMAMITVKEDLLHERRSIVFSSESLSGMKINTTLAKGLFVAELSGNEALHWREIVFAMDYARRMDYVKEDTAKGSVHEISMRADDAIIPKGGKMPTITVRKDGKVDRRYFEVRAETFSQ